MLDQTSALPKVWKVTTLEKVCRKITDGSHFSPKMVKDGFPMASVKDMTEFGFDLDNCKRISSEDYHRLVLDDCKPLINDVLIAKDGSYLKHVFVTNREIDLVILSSIAILRPDINIIDPNYLKYILTNPIFVKYIENGFVSGSVLPRIVLKDFKRISITVPTLLEQQAVAAVLTALDGKIELLRKQNITLEAAAQVIFKEWFVNFNFPGSTGKMIDSNLGKIPENWIVGTLNNFIRELESGRRPKGGVGVLKTGIPSVGAESINGISGFDFSKTKYISEEFYNNMNTGKVKDYDILVYKDGGTPGTFLPRFSMVGEGFPFSKFAINEHVFRVQTKKDHQRFFLYLWLNSYYCKRELQNIGGKAAIPGINSTDFRDISLLIPDESILKLYHQATVQSFKKILVNNSQIQTLSKLRDTLLPKLMKGEIRVKGFRN